MIDPDDVAARSRDEGHYERVALAHVLAYPRSLESVRGWLRPEDFTWPVHRAIYESALRLNSVGDPVDRTTVLADLQRHQYPDPHHRLMPYVLDMDNHVVVPMSAAYHCRNVLEHSIRRRLEEVGMRLQQIGERGVGTADELLDQADRIVGQLQEARDRWDGCEAPRRAREDAGVQERDGQLYGVAQTRPETQSDRADYSL